MASIVSTTALAISGTVLAVSACQGHVQRRTWLTFGVWPVDNGAEEHFCRGVIDVAHQPRFRLVARRDGKASCCFINLLYCRREGRRTLVSPVPLAQELFDRCRTLQQLPLRQCAVLFRSILPF